MAKSYPHHADAQKPCTGLAFSAVFGLALGAFLSTPAHSVPSYSDQTGDSCSACHVGAFGPQLTAHGRAFKLTGYSDGTKVRTLPLLSGMVETSFTNTGRDQSGPAASGFNANNNVAVDQISIFLAGRIYDHLGVFDQNTWDGVGHVWGWDNLDLRYGNEFKLGNVDAILGITLNNNPTVTDPYNSTPAWGFPYASSPLALGPPATVIEDGLGGRVLGGTVYAMLDDVFYAEVGAFGALPGLSHGSVLGANPGDGPVVSGGAPYWRLAVQEETPALSIEAGTFGIAAEVFPGNDHSAGTDNYLDIGADFSFQWHKTKRHVFSVYGTAIFENTRLNSSFATGAVQVKDSNLNSFKVNASYYYHQTYGVTGGLFAVRGTEDAVLFGPAQDSGSRTNSPNASGYVLQLDWTPFGKDDSFLQPWANLRIALQYTGYFNFNGNFSNYDGFNRDATANNTLYLLGWISF